VKTFVAFVVRTDSRRVEHWEIFEATDLGAVDLAGRIIDKTTKLRALYSPSAYDVSCESYNTFGAMQRKNPELELDPSHLVPWS
jgi:hypothetical protein